jgi:hypothetical protein
MVPYTEQQLQTCKIVVTARIERGRLLDMFYAQLMDEVTRHVTGLSMYCRATSAGPKCSARIYAGVNSWTFGMVVTTYRIARSLWVARITCGASPAKRMKSPGSSTCRSSTGPRRAVPETT